MHLYTATGTHQCINGVGEICLPNSIVSSNRSFKVFRTSPNNPKIFLSVLDRPHKNEGILEQVHGTVSDFFGLKDSDTRALPCAIKSGILLCATTKQVDNLYVLFSSKYREPYPNRVHRFHKQMDAEGMSDKAFADDIIGKWKEHGGLLIATYVVAEGIDNPDCDFVYQLGVPMNLEAAIQGLGRCGRRHDDPIQKCIAIFSMSITDIKSAFSKISSHKMNQGDFTRSSAMSESEKLSLQRVYDVFSIFATGECIRQKLLEQFEDDGFQVNRDDNPLDNCCSNCSLGEVGQPKQVSPELLRETVLLIWKTIDEEMKKNTEKKTSAKGVPCGKLIAAVVKGKDKDALRKRIANDHGRPGPPSGRTNRVSLSHRGAHITQGELATKFCRFVCISGFKEGWFSLEFPATANN